MRVAVLGSGAWGTTLAQVLIDKGIPVVLWEHRSDRAQHMRIRRENTEFLPGIPLHPDLEITEDLETAVTSANVVLFVMPTQLTRTNARQVAQYISSTAYVITASKGLEIHSFSRVSEILAEELPEGPRDRIVALSGPNLAREIAAGLPAATVVASHNEEVAHMARELLNTNTFRVYSTDDIVGVEIGGALKNVIAIAIGAADGLGFGQNSKSALMTRGLAEIVRLSRAEGANPLTLSGLAGLGDLIATCSSTLSRNYSLGYELVTTGQSLDEVLSGRHTVAEGVMTAYAALEMAARHEIQMPISRALCDLFEGCDARTLVTSLLQRDPRSERDQ
jgi:glycerol-3-phosphate dehydrogenase (NAD(P)+)